MSTNDIDRFGKIIRGFIRSHQDVNDAELVPDPVAWLAARMDKSERTIEDYLSNPSTMTLATQAFLKQILREKLISGDSIDVIVKLIDSIPERKS